MGILQLLGHRVRILLVFSVPPCPIPCPIVAADDIAPITRRLPPQGIALSEATANALQADLAAVEAELGATGDPDIAIFSKAVRFALLHREFYKPEQVDTARALLAEAQRRLAEPDWGQHSPGLVVRGYRSSIDGSVQPYGLEIPDGLDQTEPAPLWVWLHGRGDQETDMHFIHNRMRQRGPFQPDNALVLHPFGRQCVGWKWAGEVDVFEAIDAVAANYAIDRKRIALMGFSMGGAGAWHIGAHYSDRFAVVHPGAGFAETRAYNRLRPEDYPPSYEQALWGIYDVPEYARNFLETPLIAYSGENDRQIQAARVMEEALATHGHTLRHVIGAKMGHEYDDASKAEIETFVREATTGSMSPAVPATVHLQTRTLRYARQRWVEITGLEHHWRDSRVDARVAGMGALEITTQGITSLRIHEPATGEQNRTGGTVPIRIDGDSLAGRLPVHLLRVGGRWKQGFPEPGLRKSPGLQGPIDDAFMAPFLFVTPTAASADPAVQCWVDFERAHQEARWRALFRGDIRSKPADEVTPADAARYNLILWGDRAMNPLVAAVIDGIEGVGWDAESIRVGSTTRPAAGKVLAMIHPNPASPERYIVLNSGPTFREDHDRTNSLQNAKLPDWAVIGLDQKPSATAPGEILAAGFFDERWRP